MSARRPIASFTLLLAFTAAAQAELRRGDGTANTLPARPNPMSTGGTGATTRCMAKELATSCTTVPATTSSPVR